MYQVWNLPGYHDFLLEWNLCLIESTWRMRLLYCHRIISSLCLYVTKWFCQFYMSCCSCFRCCRSMFYLGFCVCMWQCKTVSSICYVAPLLSFLQCCSGLCVQFVYDFISSLCHVALLLSVVCSTIGVVLYVCSDFKLSLDRQLFAFIRQS